MSARAIHPLTITGTPGDDLITGTIGDDVVLAGGGDDTVQGLGGDDYLAGQAGDDLLNGGSGDDTLVGAAGADTLAGGSGDDLILAGDSAKDVIDGGSGHDILSFAVAAQAADISDDGLAHVQGVEEIVGSAFADTIVAAAGIEVVDGGEGGDHLSSSLGASLIGGEGDDFLFDVGGRASGGAGDDFLTGRNGATLVGGAGNDDLTSEYGVNLLLGGAGDDLLNCANAGGTMNGGLGKDVLYGTAAFGLSTPVTFQFDETARHGVDEIGYMEANDTIDLSAIDADVNTAGDQAFHTVSAFSGHAGELVVKTGGPYDRILMDTDGDGAADISIRVEPYHGFGSFVL